MICEKCGKNIDKYKIRNFCSTKCYDNWRYVNNINGRKDKMRIVDNIRNNRKKYIKTLTADQLLDLIQNEEEYYDESINNNY